MVTTSMLKQGYPERAHLMKKSFPRNGITTKQNITSVQKITTKKPRDFRREAFFFSSSGGGGN